MLEKEVSSLLSVVAPTAILNNNKHTLLIMNMPCIGMVTYTSALPGERAHASRPLLPAATTTTIP